MNTCLFRNFCTNDKKDARYTGCCHSCNERACDIRCKDSLKACKFLRVVDEMPKDEVVPVKQKTPVKTKINTSNGDAIITKKLQIKKILK